MAQAFTIKSVTLNLKNDVRMSILHRAVAAMLQHNYTVYTYDRRGRGDSGDTLPFEIEREVEDLAALIENAGGSAYVYGISSGAALAIEAAIRRHSGRSAGSA